MIPSDSSALGRRVALGIALGAAFLLVLTPPAHANGVDVGGRDVYAGDVGPYTLRVSTAPVTGLMHLNVYLSLKGTETPPQDASVRLRAAHRGGGEETVGPIAVPGALQGPNWFAADLLIESPGVWEFTLSVDAPAGREQVTFPVVVQEAGGTSLSLLALVAVAGGGLAFWLGHRWFGRGRRRARRRRT